MMTLRILFSSGLLFLLGSISAVFAEDEISSVPEVTVVPEVIETVESTGIIEPTPEASNAALQVLKDKSEKLQEQFSPSEIEQEEKQKQEELETVQIEKQTLENINSEIENEVEVLKSQLAEQEALKSQLETAQNENVQSKEELQTLQSSLSELQKSIETKNILLDKNQQDISILAQEEELKEYALRQNLELQKALQEKSDGERQKKRFIFFLVTCGFLLVYGVRFSLAKRYADNPKLQKKYAHQFAAFDVLSLVLYLGFLVWFFFYLFPELVVYLLFLVGALVVVFREYLLALFSSIFIVQLYHVGERVRFGRKGVEGSTEGVIERFTLLKTFIRSIDDTGTNIQELRVVPNSKFMLDSVTILPKSEIEKTSYEVILPNDHSINQPEFIRHIEQNVLQKYITTKSFNAITETEYYYYLDFAFTNTGHPIIKIIWHETREKSNRIKRKIIAEMEKFKKNAQVDTYDVSKNMKSDDE